MIIVYDVQCSQMKSQHTLLLVDWINWTNPQRERQQLVENNEKLAQENIALKPELEQKQQELIELVSIQFKFDFY